MTVEAGLDGNEAALCLLDWCSCEQRVMPTSPSIVPSRDPTVYFVMDDLGGRFGTVWREVDAESTDYETVIKDLLSGKYSNPVRVISFNVFEGWSRDVSSEVAEDLQLRCHLEKKEVPRSLWAFVESHGRRKKA
jgi:hypothetical protein